MRARNVRIGLVLGILASAACAEDADVEDVDGVDDVDDVVANVDGRLDGEWAVTERVGPAPFDGLGIAGPAVEIRSGERRVSGDLDPVAQRGASLCIELAAFDRGDDTVAATELCDEDGADPLELRGEITIVTAEVDLRGRVVLVRE